MEGVAKAKDLKKSMKLNWNFSGGEGWYGVGKNQKTLSGKNGYLLEPHITNKI